MASRIWVRLAEPVLAGEDGEGWERDDEACCLYVTGIPGKTRLISILSSSLLVIERRARTVGGGMAFVRVLGLQDQREEAACPSRG